MAAGAVALPLMLVFAASIGDMPVSCRYRKSDPQWSWADYAVLPQPEEGIVWQYRMSRALMAACSGGGLARCAGWCSSQCCVTPGGALSAGHLRRRRWGRLRDAARYRGSVIGVSSGALAPAPLLRSSC